MHKISTRVILTPLISIFAFMTSPLQGYDYIPLAEDDFHSYRDEIATLRMTVFKEYPYLYDGDLAYERKYLNHYFTSKKSLVIVVKEGEQVVGAITGIPLNEMLAECKDLFIEKSIPMDAIFYLGEIVLLKEYRGLGIGARMYDLLEKFVEESKEYKQIAFCEVVSPEEDPRKTSDYFCLDSFWERRGFFMDPELTIQFPWKEIGCEEETSHTMVFWLKQLYEVQIQDGL